MSRLCAPYFTFVFVILCFSAALFFLVASLQEKKSPAVPRSQALNTSAHIKLFSSKNAPVSPILPIDKVIVLFRFLNFGFI